MAKKIPLPQPIFDTLEAFPEQDWPVPYYVDLKDYRVSYEFLKAYNGSPDTFNSYRREVDRFLQWMYLIAKKTLVQIDHPDIEAYIEFCKKPPEDWIAAKMVYRFVLYEGQKVVNPEWRPFVVKVSKQAHSNSRKPSIKRYRLSDSGIQAIFRNLSTYFTYIELEDYITKNPVKRIRQRSKFNRKKATVQTIRRLSELQWDYVIETAEIMANENRSHERTLFIMSALYGLYLRISELTESQRWTPQMNNFFQDDDGNWWFKTVGKGNKERDITVSQDMLKALKRYRKSMDLTPLPSPSDNEPLISKQKGAGALRNTKHIRDIVQSCFDEAVHRMKTDGFSEEAGQLQSATVHWLRHTGISDDVKHRPKEHVRDDAGHSSSAITDRYIDIERRERHASGKRKRVRPNV